MRSHLFAYVFIGMAVLSGGCKKASPMISLIPEKKSLIQYVESPELAKLILKPQVKQFSIPRDPFKPIVTKEKMGVSGLADQSQAGADNPLDLVFVGAVRLGQDYRALLKIHHQTGVYQVQDKIENYVVEDINLKRIVLKSGDHEIVKKRGEI